MLNIWVDKITNCVCCSHNKTFTSNIDIVVIIIIRGVCQRNLTFINSWGWEIRSIISALIHGSFEISVVLMVTVFGRVKILEIIRGIMMIPRHEIRKATLIGMI